MIQELKYISLTFIFFYASLCIPPLNAVLVQLDALTFKKTEHGPVHTCYIGYDAHEHAADADDVQVSSFDSILRMRDNKRKPLHLFVEVPPRIDNELNYSHKVTTESLSLAEKYPSIIAENVEFRVNSGAALSMLHPLASSVNYVSPQSIFSVGKKECMFGHVSFVTVLQELACHKLNLAERLDDPFLVPFIDKKLKEYEEHEKCLLSALTTAQLPMQKVLLDLIKKRTFSFDNQLKIYEYLLLLCSTQFDLNALHLIQHNISSDCALIIGADHAAWISMVLKKMGAERVTYGNGESYLGPQSFSIFAEI